MVGRVIIIALLSLPTIGLAEDCVHDSAHFRCVKYVNNYDGDTITVQIPGVHPLLGENIHVRVAGIDAPELKARNICERRQAKIAKEIVSEVLERAKRIDLENIARDKYFRILADVVADGQSLKTLLLSRKLAYAYLGKTKKKMNWCQTTSRFASAHP